MTHIKYCQIHVCAYVRMTRDKIVKEKYSAVFNSAVADKNRRIAEIKTPQKLPAIRYSLSNSSLGKGKDDEKERESASTPTVEKGGKQKGNGQFFCHFLHLIRVLEEHVSPAVALIVKCDYQQSVNAKK